MAYLLRGAAIFGISLSVEQMSQFRLFAEMLEEANRKMNLTRISSENITELHFLDSLSAASFIHPSTGMEVLDIGTGAGFPGAPLAIAFPDAKYTLADGTLKKLEFVDTVIAALGLKNAHTLHCRAEEMGRKAEYRNHYDLVTARAVAPMPRLAAWLLPLIKPAGAAIAYKGRGLDEEMAAAAKAISALSGRIERIINLCLPETEIERKLVILRKVSSIEKTRVRTSLR